MHNLLKLKWTISARKTLLILLLLLTACSVQENPLTVINVIDGDTIVLNNGQIVRLICVDAPEKDELGYAESKQALQKLVQDKNITLEKDVNERDKYGRLLRYVYADGVDVGAEMVKSGYAEVFEYGADVKYCEEYRELEKDLYT